MVMEKVRSSVSLAWEMMARPSKADLSATSSWLVGEGWSESSGTWLEVANWEEEGSALGCEEEAVEEREAVREESSMGGMGAGRLSRV
jgi:hypothetical protein